MVEVVKSRRESKIRELSENFAELHDTKTEFETLAKMVPGIKNNPEAKQMFEHISSLIEVFNKLVPRLRDAKVEGLSKSEIALRVASPALEQLNDQQLDELLLALEKQTDAIQKQPQVRPRTEEVEEKVTYSAPPEKDGGMMSMYG